MMSLRFLAKGAVVIDSVVHPLFVAVDETEREVLAAPARLFDDPIKAAMTLDLQGKVGGWIYKTRSISTKPIAHGWSAAADHLMAYSVIRVWRRANDAVKPVWGEPPLHYYVDLRRAHALGYLFSSAFAQMAQSHRGNKSVAAEVRRLIDANVIVRDAITGDPLYATSRSEVYDDVV